MLTVHTASFAIPTKGETTEKLPPPWNTMEIAGTTNAFASRSGLSMQYKRLNSKTDKYYTGYEHRLTKHFIGSTESPDSYGFDICLKNILIHTQSYDILIQWF